MTKQDALELLKPLDQAAQLKWLADLGLDLTICARSGYPASDAPGNITIYLALMNYGTRSMEKSDVCKEAMIGHLKNSSMRFSREPPVIT